MMSYFTLRKRPLTPGERALAQEVFTQELQLDDIKIIAHRLILKGYAMSPNGNIYFNIADYCDDFSQQNLAVQSWLIHELVHVWQIQQGMKVVRRAIFDRRYRYRLLQDKSFYQYGIEQQAQMVQDYFLKMRQNLPCDDLKQCIPFVQ